MWPQSLSTICICAGTWSWSPNFGYSSSGSLLPGSGCSLTRNTSRSLLCNNTSRSLLRKTNLKPGLQLLPALLLPTTSDMSIMFQMREQQTNIMQTKLDYKSEQSSGNTLSLHQHIGYSTKNNIFLIKGHTFQSPHSKTSPTVMRHC